MTIMRIYKYIPLRLPGVLKLQKIILFRNFKNLLCCILLLIPKIISTYIFHTANHILLNIKQNSLVYTFVFSNGTDNHLSESLKIPTGNFLMMIDQSVVCFTVFVCLSQKKDCKYKLNIKLGQLEILNKFQR